MCALMHRHQIMLFLLLYLSRQQLRVNEIIYTWRGRRSGGKITMRFRISLTKLDVLISNVDTLFTLRVLQTKETVVNQWHKIHGDIERRKNLFQVDDRDKKNGFLCWCHDRILINEHHQCRKDTTITVDSFVLLHSGVITDNNDIVNYLWLLISIIRSASCSYRITITSIEFRMFLLVVLCRTFSCTVKALLLGEWPTLENKAPPTTYGKGGGSLEQHRTDMQNRIFIN